MSIGVVIGWRRRYARKEREGESGVRSCGGLNLSWREGMYIISYIELLIRAETSRLKIRSGI